MQIVIDITENEWNYLNKLVENDDILGHYERLIVNGTPLLKGHGRLKDEDEIKRMIENAIVNSEHSKTFAENIIRFAPTIIEADKQTSGCSSCPHSGSIIDGHKDCPDAYTEQSQYCGLNNKEK